MYAQILDGKIRPCKRIRRFARELDKIFQNNILFRSQIAFKWGLDMEMYYEKLSESSVVYNTCFSMFSVVQPKNPRGTLIARALVGVRPIFTDSSGWVWR